MLYLLLATVFAEAGVPPAPKFSFELDVPEIEAGGACYPSGLQGVYVSRPGTGTATAVWMIDAGQAADPEGEGGTMHLLEHLWFQSHPQKGEAFRNAAWHLEAHAETHVDTTVFHATAAPDDLANLLKLHSWVLAAPLFGVDEDIFEAEKKVVKQEQWYRGAHGDRAAVRLLDRALFPKDHPYHSVLAGTDELDGLTLESVSAVSAATYVPAGATLYVEADMPVEAIAEVVQASLPARLTGGEGADCTHAEAPLVPAAPATTELVTMQGPRWRPAVYVGWTIPPHGPDDEAMLELVGDVLRANFYQELSGVPGLKKFDSTESIHCGPRFGRLASRYRCVIDLPPRVDPENVVKAIRRALSDAGSSASNDDFVVRTRVGVTADRLRTQWLHDQDSSAPGDVIDRALLAHHHSSVSLLLGRLAGLATLKWDTMSDYIGKWMTADRMAAVAVVPSAGQSLSLKVIDPSPRLPVSEHAWTPPPGARGLTTRTLPNGLHSWVLSQASAPISHVDLVFQGGEMREPVTGTGEVLDHLAQYSMPYGMSFEELRSKAGVLTRRWNGPWSSGLVAEGASGNLDVGLWAVRAMHEGLVLDMSRRQSRLDNEARFTLSKYGGLPVVFEGPAAYAHLFPEHRAGMAWWDWNMAARTVRDDKVRSWRIQMYRPERTTAIIASNRPASEVDPLVEKYLGKMSSKGKPQPMPQATDPLPDPPDRAGFALEFPGLTSHVTARCRVPGLGPEDFATSLVARAALDRALFETLRSSGGTYSPVVGLHPLTPELAVLSLSAEVAPADGGPATAAILAVTEAVASGDHPDFIADAVVKARFDWGRRWASATEARRTLRTAATWGIDVERLERMGDDIDAVDATAVAAFLAACEGHEAVTLTGHDARKHLESAGLKVTDIDWKAQRQAVLDELE